MPKQTFLRLENEKQERIIRSAIDEFQKNGYEKAKVGDISKKAGIAKGSIYQYFDDKEDLFCFTVSWTYEYFLQNQHQQVLVQILDILEYLLSSSRQRMEIIQKEPGLAKFLQDVHAGVYNPVTPGLADGIWWISDEHLQQMIQTGKSKGSVRQDVEDEVLLVFVKGIMEKIDQMVIDTLKTNHQKPAESLVEILDRKSKEFMKLIRTGMGS